MVPALELTDEEVLERLQKMLKGASVVPLTVSEYCAKNPPPAVSFLFVRVLFVFLLLYLFSLNLPCLVVLFFHRNWGITSLTRFPLTPSLPLWGLGVVLLGLL